MAGRSGISKGMLVQIEQARTNPSIGTLCRLADAFGVTLAQIVELSDTTSVRVVDPDEVVRLWSGEEGSAGDLLVGADRREHVELWRWTIAAGDDHESEGHLEGTREMMAVLSGHPHPRRRRRDPRRAGRRCGALRRRRAPTPTATSTSARSTWCWWWCSRSSADPGRPQPPRLSRRSSAAARRPAGRRWPAGRPATGASGSGRPSPCGPPPTSRPRSRAGRTVTCTSRPAGDSRWTTTGTRPSSTEGWAGCRTASCTRTCRAGTPSA